MQYQPVSKDQRKIEEIDLNKANNFNARKRALKQTVDKRVVVEFSLLPGHDLNHFVTFICTTYKIV
jgi:hypothetical protein